MSIGCYRERRRILRAGPLAQKSDCTGLPGRMRVTLDPTKPGLRGVGGQQGRRHGRCPRSRLGAGERPRGSQVAGRPTKRASSSGWSLRPAS
jgi:hypothetical protein